MHNQSMSINQMDIMNSTTCLVDYGNPKVHIANGGVTQNGYTRHVNHGSVDERNRTNHTVIYS